MRPEFDEKDEQLRQARIEARQALRGPLVGDFVRFPDGSLRRFTYDWSDHVGEGGLQTTCAGNIDESFYLGASGHMSYSGSLDPILSSDKLTDTGEVKDGRCWFFHRDYSIAHSAVHMTVPCRVYAYNP